MSRTGRQANPIVARAIVTAQLVLVIAFASLVVVPTPVAAESPPFFSANARVNVPPAYTAYSPSIAVGTDGVAYLAYAGWAGSSTQADTFFSKSSDGGRTWTAPMRVNSDTGGASQSDPALALDSANNIYIAWVDSRGGGTDIYFSRSSDGGLSFSANPRVNDITTSFQTEPAITVDSQGLIHVVWTDNRNAITTGPDIYYANSTDGGLTFNVNLRVNNDATGVEQARPAIAAAADRSVYAVWDDPRNGARGRDIYFSRSTDLGVTWSPNIIVNDDSANIAQTNVAIAVDVSAIYLAWVDSRIANTAPDIYATRSTNGGVSFAASVPVSDDNGLMVQFTPAIAARAGTVHIAWSDARTIGSTGLDIYRASSTDGIVWSPNLKVNDDTLVTNDQLSPTIAVDAAGNVFAAWFDERIWQDVYAGSLDVEIPTANAGLDRTVDQDSIVQFDASSSSDNLGIASVYWAFGDGTGYWGTAGSHSYATPGQYLATLTITDHSGNVASASVQITVLDTVAPVARGVGDRTVDEGQALFFDASGSTDNVAVVSYSWDLGDGTMSAAASVSHVYASPGTYAVTLTVSDGAGNTDMESMSITVQAVSPKSSELLAMIQTLAAVVSILAIALAVVGYIAFKQRRQGRPPNPTTTVPLLHSPPSEGPDPIDVPLSPSEPPKAS